MSKYRMAEQVHRSLSGGDPSAGSRYDIREIILYIEQIANERLKVSHFSETMASGVTIPDGARLAEYVDIPVEDYGKVSRAKLPASPISLPRNMGVFLVGPMDDPFRQYIPLQTGQWGMVRGQIGMSNLLGHVGYEIRENYLVFTKNITSAGKLRILLVIYDFNKYDDFAPLPIPPDMEKVIIDEATKYFAARNEPSKIVESITTKP